METGAERSPKNVGMVGEELSVVSEKGGNIFELFRTHDGEEYTVYMRDDGKRFYVDFEEQVGGSAQLRRQWGRRLEIWEGKWRSVGGGRKRRKGRRPGGRRKGGREKKEDRGKEGNESYVCVIFLALEMALFSFCVE
jgi:hypothetical protein